MPALEDYSPEHQDKVQAYMEANLHRLPETIPYDQSKLRSLDKYTHSKEHRALVRTASGSGSLDELQDAFFEELSLTAGTRYELWSWTLLAEGCWTRDAFEDHKAAVKSGVEVSSQQNRPDDILGEWICDDSDSRDPLTLAGVK